jgi:hypothetical protein
MELTQTDVIGLVVAVIAGMIIAFTGGGTLAMIIMRIDRRTKDDIERLYMALPPVWQDTILKIVETSGALVKVAKEVTDKQPNE